MLLDFFFFFFFIYSVRDQLLTNLYCLSTNCHSLSSYFLALLLFLSLDQENDKFLHCSFVHMWFCTVHVFAQHKDSFVLLFSSSELCSD